jgi:hypothetical protein
MYIKYKERRITFQLIYDSVVDGTPRGMHVPICTLAKVPVNHLKMRCMAVAWRMLPHLRIIELTRSKDDEEAAWSHLLVMHVANGMPPILACLCR